MNEEYKKRFLHKSLLRAQMLERRMFEIKVGNTDEDCVVNKEQKQSLSFALENLQNLKVIFSWVDSCHCFYVQA